MSYDSRLDGVLKLIPPPEDLAATRSSIAHLELDHRGGAATLSADGHLALEDGVDWEVAVQSLRAISAALRQLGIDLQGEVRARGEDDEELALIRVSPAAIQVDEVERSDDDDLGAWIEALDGPDGEMQVHAAQQLAVFGAGGVPALTRATAEDRPFRLRRTALESLGEIGRPAEAAFEHVSQCLSDPDPQIRYWATFVLGRMGPRALRARDALVRMRSQEREHGPKYGAIDALSRLDRLDGS